MSRLPIGALSSFVIAGAFVAALVSALCLTAAVRRWALGRGLLDMPDGRRRLHSRPIPNVGGIAIACSVVGVFVLSWALQQQASGDDSGLAVLGMVVGGIAMWGVGLVDDLRELSPYRKLALQVGVAVLAFSLGVRIGGVDLIVVHPEALPGWLSLVITTLWLVGATNAFNFIDGSDGVAAGAALFASGALLAVFLLNGDALGALMAATLAGAALGFLFFNFPPASIFLGDSGSHFLGFTLAALGVITTHKATTAVAMAIPVVAFGLPLLDTALVVTRRFLRRDPVFLGDRGHIHHRLRDLGHSPRMVAVTIYAVCGAFGALSLLLAVPRQPAVLPIMVVACCVLCVLVIRLDIPELVELQRIVGRLLQQRHVIAHNVRVHEAVRDLRGCSHVQHVFALLDRTFDRSEFSSLSLRLCGVGSGGDVDATPIVEELPMVWRMDAPVGRTDEAEIEVRIPLRSSRELVGYLFLRRRGNGARLFTDVNLLADRFAPALSEAISRCHGREHLAPVAASPEDVRLEPVTPNGFASA